VATTIVDRRRRDLGRLPAGEKARAAAAAGAVVGEVGERRKRAVPLFRVARFRVK
jgi:hypothetical protein